MLPSNFGSGLFSWRYLEVKHTKNTLQLEIRFQFLFELKVNSVSISIESWCTKLEISNCKWISSLGKIYCTLNVYSKGSPSIFGTNYPVEINLSSSSTCVQDVQSYNTSHYSYNLKLFHIFPSLRK